jgi:hypothetical protein
MALVTVYSAAADLVVTPTSLVFDGDYNDTIVRSVLVRNTGNGTLSNIEFSKSGLSDFDFAYSSNNFDLAAGANRSVDISLTVPEFSNPIEHAGTITAASGSIKDDVAVTVDLTDAETLVISSLDIEGDDIKNEETKTKIKPLQEVDFDVTVENNRPDRDDEIDNIVVSITVKNIEDGGEDDIELESEDFSLDGNGDDQKTTLSFVVPYDVEHETEYEVEIVVQGEDDDNNDYEVVWTVYLEVKKERDLLRLTESGIEPEAITCSQRYVEISAISTNMGSNDQDDAVLHMKNIALGIDKKFFFTMDSDPDKDDFEVTSSYSLTVPNDAAPGTYNIDLYLYYDVDKQIDHKTVALTVPDCNPTTTTTVPANQSSGISGQGLTPGISYSSESAGFRGSWLYIVLLVMLIILAVLGVAFMSVKLYKSF